MARCGPARATIRWSGLGQGTGADTGRIQIGVVTTIAQTSCGGRELGGK